MLLRPCLLMALMTGCCSSVVAAPRSGDVIYQQDCASCHGTDGTGSPEHKKPLLGDLSIGELAKFIDKTMPHGEPEKIGAEESRIVAEYIHGAFYSATAQERIRPARVELARLTVRQYQQTIADLLASFRGGPQFAKDADHGLRAEYYKLRRIDRRNRVIERVDPQVAFDFGEASPDDEKLEAHEFSIRWEGSIRPPQTGEYEFIVRTEHAARLWINDLERPLIDAWVKSGNDTEYKASLRLLGGRDYAVRLDYSKAKQGVDDSKDGKPKPKAKSSIAFWWQPPHQAPEVVPNHVLHQATVPTTYVVQTPFPPDDRSVGYERGTSISAAWDEATTEAAIEIADEIQRQRERYTGAKDDAGDRREKYQSFARRFVERALRRPLNEELRQLYIEHHFADGIAPYVALRRVILLTLKSPRFLFREVDEPANDPYAIAARLSYGAWDSLPDDRLLKAAEKNQLQTPAQIQAEADRLLNDRRAIAKLQEFFHQWLRTDHAGDLAKDPQAYPEFSPTIVNDLKASLDLFLEGILTSDTADFRQILTADAIPMNGRLARFYGAELPADALFQSIAFEPEQRAGVLSHPLLMASFAYRDASSPIHRGVWLSRSLLGRFLKPPPEAVAPLAIDLQPDLTTRERVTLQTQSESCRACHNLINPLGFTLEQFDAVGRFRATERNKPIDPRGEYIARNGETAELQGARALANYLVNSDETRSAFVEQLFQFEIKQPIRAYGADRLSQLKTAFTDQQFHIRKLAARIIAEAALVPNVTTTAAK